MYIAWSNGHIWDPAAQLYERDPHSPILMRYVQSPIMAGEQTLCEATGDQSMCAAAAALGNAQLRAFPAAANHGPQYDSIYLQWMLYQYAQDHDSRWYALAYYNAQRALANSGDKAGLFLQDWDGDHAPSDSSFQIESATLSLFASVAAAQPPSRSQYAGFAGGRSLGSAPQYRWRPATCDPTTAAPRPTRARPCWSSTSAGSSCRA